MKKGVTMNVDFQKTNSNLPISLESASEKIFKFSIFKILHIAFWPVVYHVIFQSSLILDVLIEIVFIRSEFCIFLGKLLSSSRRFFGGPKIKNTVDQNFLLMKKMNFG